jgi:hypothetical protein
MKFSPKLYFVYFSYGGVKLHQIETTKQTPALLAASMGEFDMLLWMNKKKFPLTNVDSLGMSIGKFLYFYISTSKSIVVVTFLNIIYIFFKYFLQIFFNFLTILHDW